jgi:excisionase family DNA binding protein
MNTKPDPHVRPAISLATVSAVAAHLCLSRSKIYQLMHSGRLPYVKLGRCRRIHWNDVEALIAESRIGST